jgi:putative oxidoreductase
MIKQFFTPGKNSASANLALLILRLWIGIQMLLVHGMDKLVNFKTAAHDFPDPLGVGHTASLALAVFAEVICSALIALGLLTRFAALVLVINMAVAFISVHKLALTGAHNGELAFLYLLAYIILFVAGPGRVSMDKTLFGNVSGQSR